MGRVPLERRADWLVLATRLVLLRSKLLLPANHEDRSAAEEEAREARTLPDRLTFRTAAAWLTGRPYLGIDALPRGMFEPPRREGGYVALMEACLVVLRGRGGRPEEALVYRQVVPDLWRVSDALVRIRSILAEHPEGGELARYLPALAPDDPRRSLKARAAVASTVLADLELVRQGIIEIEQQADFGSVWLRSVQLANGGL